MRHIAFDKPHRFFFETLGDKTRWDIVHLLQKGPCRSTDIAEKLGYEQSLVSHHLRRLETCGFVTARQNGNERIYTLNAETIKPLLAFMDAHVNKYCKNICTKNKK